MLFAKLNVTMDITCFGIYRIYRIFDFLVVSIFFQITVKMSMYDRKERKTDLVLNSTAPIVGPGSYDVDKPEKSKVRKGNRVIFL